MEMKGASWSHRGIQVCRAGVGKSCAAVTRPRAHHWRNDCAAKVKYGSGNGNYCFGQRASAKDQHRSTCVTDF